MKLLYRECFLTNYFARHEWAPVSTISTLNAGPFLLSWNSPRNQARCDSLRRDKMLPAASNDDTNRWWYFRRSRIYQRQSARKTRSFFFYSFIYLHIYLFSYYFFVIFFLGIFSFLVFFFYLFIYWLILF